MICSFFGHRRVPDGVGEILEKELSAIIEACSPDLVFYVGDKGQFDRLVQLTLAKLKGKHPDAEVYVVLDSIPTEKNYFNLSTVVPETVETAPRRFAISHRNRWMIENCDVAIVYFTDVTSNTRKHVDLLRRKNKTVINIADMLPFFLDNPSSLC